MNEQTNSEERFEKWFYDAGLNYNEEYRGAKAAWNEQERFWSKRVEEMEKEIFLTKKALKAAIDLIEEYETLYGDAYKYGRIKTYTLMLENLMRNVPKCDSQLNDKNNVLPSQISDTKRDGFNSKD